MPSSHAAVAIETPGQCLARRIRHVARDRPTTLARDNGTGRIDFAMRPRDLAIRDGARYLRVAGATRVGRDRLQDVVARHPLRFAFRAPPTVTWV